MRTRLTADEVRLLERHTLYDEQYYRQGCGPIPYARTEQWLSSAARSAAAIVDRLHPRSALDVGCALGFLVESLRDRGVDAYGIDISHFAIENVRPDMQPYCKVADIVQGVPGRYDVVTCIEVLEHLLPEEVEKAISNLSALSDTILFSSSPIDFTEPTHFNVQQPVEWLETFGKAGFSPDVYFDASFIAPHAMLLRRTGTRLAPEVERVFADLIGTRAKLTEHADKMAEFLAKNEELSTHLQGLSDMNAEIFRQRQEVSSQLAAFMDKNNEMATVIDAEYKRSARLQKHCDELETELKSIQGRSALPPAIHMPDLSAFQDSELMREMFDEQYYLAQNPKMSEEDAGPFEHFVREGWRKGLNPHPLFDVSFYITSNPDVLASQMNPLAHFVRYGAFEGRNPHPDFDALRYFAENRDIAEAGANPVLHFLRFGKAEDRKVFPVGVNRFVTANYGEWITQTEPRQDGLSAQTNIVRELHARPVISIIVPVYKVPLDILREMVDSVRAQTYDCWELCIAHADPDNTEARAYLAELASTEPRIRLGFLSSNFGIAENSNQALKLATGEFIALLDHDDILASSALYEMARAINDSPKADFLYSDKDTLSEFGPARINPLFKPQWSPAAMLSANYLTHLCVIRTACVRQVGGWRSETDGAQDWDLFLRVLDTTKNIVFVPGVLYHWRRVPTSVSVGGLSAKPYAAVAQLKTLQDHLSRIGVDASVTFAQENVTKVRWKIPAEAQTSIIIVDDETTEDAGIDTARRLADLLPANCNIILPISSDGTVNHARIRTVRVPHKSHVAHRLNAAARASTADFLVFLDRYCQPVTENWIHDLLGPLHYPGVGITSAKILDSKGHLRHVGIVFNSTDGTADYAFAGQPNMAHGVFGGTAWYRNWSAVAGSCFALRRTTFERLAGFNEDRLYPRLDIDLCLHMQIETDQTIFYTPFVECVQDQPGVLERWLSATAPLVGASRIHRYFPSGDPFFHPYLDCRYGNVAFFKGALPNPKHDYADEAHVLVNEFDCSSAERQQSTLLPEQAHTAGNVCSINWFLPEFSHPFYGGIHTILRFADFFTRHHNVTSNFAFISPSPPVLLHDRIASAFPALAESCQVITVRDEKGLEEVPSAEASIATLWTTAYHLLKFNRTRGKFYFIQDYEAMFYPAGSISALVESTYRMGFAGICNTAGLRDMYREHGGRAMYFDPCVDPSVFYCRVPEGERPSQPFTLFCYVRPSHPRNCFEMVAEALRIVKRRLGPRIQILTAGARWDPASFNLQGVVVNLGLLGYKSTSAVYRSCNAGLVMMMTRHPSYLPFELMGCGSLVITNQNRYTEWFLKDRVNCLLTDTTCTAIAETIEKAALDHELRARIAAEGQRQVIDGFTDWDSQAERTFAFISENC